MTRMRETAPDLPYTRQPQRRNVWRMISRRGQVRSPSAFYELLAPVLTAKDKE